jgi:CrcB protein
MNWPSLLGIAGGGALGALGRYWLSGWIQRLTRSPLPWGTFAVNITGAMVLGLLWGVAQKMTLSPALRAGILTGLLGAFTTFSTFSLETVNLLSDRQYLSAAGYLLGSCAAGVVACLLGIWIARLALA